MEFRYEAHDCFNTSCGSHSEPTQSQDHTPQQPAALSMEKGSAAIGEMSRGI